MTDVENPPAQEIAMEPIVQKEDYPGRIQSQLISSLSKWRKRTYAILLITAILVPYIIQSIFSIASPKEQKVLDNTSQILNDLQAVIQAVSWNETKH